MSQNKRVVITGMGALLSVMMSKQHGECLKRCKNGTIKLHVLILNLIAFT